MPAGATIQSAPAGTAGDSAETAAAAGAVVPHLWTEEEEIGGAVGAGGDSFLPHPRPPREEEMNR